MEGVTCYKSEQFEKLHALELLIMHHTIQYTTTLLMKLVKGYHEQLLRIHHHQVSH